VKAWQVAEKNEFSRISGKSDVRDSGPAAVRGRQRNPRPSAVSDINAAPSRGIGVFLASC
jgi:hypothetical protein